MSIRPIELTPDEIAARTWPCSDCNAPAGVACHRIEWKNKTPRLKERPYHGRRLKWARKQERKGKP